MCLGFSRFGSWIVIVWFALSGPLLIHVYAQGKPQPRRSLELSETNSAEILTNLNQLTTRQDGFKQLDDQLMSLQSILSQNSMDASFSAPYLSPTRSALPKKTIKELLDRQNNWSLTAEELGTTSSRSVSDVLSEYSVDQSDNKKSSLQQFTDTLNRTGGDRQNADQSKEDRSIFSNKHADFRDQNGPADDSNLPPAIRDPVQKLKELVNEDTSSIFGPVRARPSFENFFGLNENSPTPDQVGARTKDLTSMESFVDQFKKALDSSTTAVNLNSALRALAPGEAARRSSVSPSLEPLPTAAHHELTESTPGNLNSFLSGTTLPDLNAAVLNQWNPLYTPPKLELPKVTPPSPPDLVFPRRRF